MLIFQTGAATKQTSLVKLYRKLLLCKTINIISLLHSNLKRTLDPSLASSDVAIPTTVIVYFIVVYLSHVKINRTPFINIPRRKFKQAD